MATERITDWSDSPTPTELFFDDFESYGGLYANFDDNWGGGADNMLDAAYAYAGSYGVQRGSAHELYRIGGIAPTTDTVLFGGRFKWNGVGGSYIEGLAAVLGAIASHDGFNKQCKVYASADGKIHIGTYGIDRDVTATPVLTVGWNYITGKLQISNTGVYEVWVNNVLVLSGTADLLNSLYGAGIAGFSTGTVSGWGVDNLWVGYATAAAVYNGANSPPIVDAGPDQEITLPPGSTTLEGSVTDDGLGSSPPVLTILWTVVSGPGSPPNSGVTFADDSDPETTVTFALPGTYVLRLTADDGDLSAFDEVTIIVTQELNPCTGGGTVEMGDDPEEGAALATASSPLLWVVLHLDSGDLPITAIPGLNDDADYHGGRKEPRLLSIGRPRLAVSDQFGGPQTAEIELVVADTDRRLRTRMRAETLTNRTFSVWIADDATRRAKGVARRRGHYAITGVEPIGDMTFRIRGADFIGSEVSGFFAERQLVDRRFGRVAFPQLPTALIDKVEAGYYGWIGDDALVTDGDPVVFDETQGYGGQEAGGFVDFGWGSIGGTAPVDLTLGEAAGGVYDSSTTLFAMVTAVIGGVETDPFPMTDGAGVSLTFTGSGKKLTLSTTAVPGATAYRWYVKDVTWGHTASPPGFRVRTETAGPTAELTDGGNENVGPWPPPDTRWTGIFSWPVYVYVLARMPASVTPVQVNRGFVAGGPWESRPGRVGWDPVPGAIEYWILTALAGSSVFANKYIAPSSAVYLDLTASRVPDEVINSREGQQGAVPLSWVGDETIGGVAYRAFFLSIGVVRINALHGSDLGTPPVRIVLPDSVFGSTFLAPLQTGWPFATQYRAFVDADGDDRWYTMVYGLAGDPVVEAAVAGTVPLTANICGFAEDARGEDDDAALSPTISSLALQCLHFLENFGNPQDGRVWKSGPWNAPHTRNGVPVHRGSAFVACKTYAETLLAGGFQGGWGFAVDGAPFTFDTWLRAAAINHDWRWTTDEHGALKPLMVNPDATAAAAFSDGSVQGPTAANIPQHAVPRIVPRIQQLVNEIRYVFKKNYVASVTNPTPAEDALLPPRLAEAIDWYSGVIPVKDDDSQVEHGGPGGTRRLVKMLEVQFQMHRSGAAPAVIVARMLARLAWPLDLVTFPASLLGCDVQNGDIVTWTHHAGAGSSGAVDRRLWLTASELEANIIPGTPSSLDVWLEGEDVTDL